MSPGTGTPPGSDVGSASTTAPPPRGVKAMAILRWVLVAAVAAVAAGSILGYAGVHLGRGAPGAPGAPDHLYHCPMHPSVVQDHPGECPICSMTLVPEPLGPAQVVAATPGSVATGGEASGGAEAGAGVPGLTGIQLSPDRVQLSGMRTAAVRRTTFAGTLRTVGVVATSERGLAQITVRFAGWIEKLR